MAARMLDLDGYLRALLATPAIALCPLFCTFLDAVDAQSFAGSAVEFVTENATRWET